MTAATGRSACWEAIFSIDQISYRRIKGVCRSARKKGILFDTGRQYEPCRYSMADGYQAARRLLGTREPVP